jgi:hypothetical protein
LYGSGTDDDGSCSERERQKVCVSATGNEKGDFWKERLYKMAIQVPVTLFFIQ